MASRIKVAAVAGAIASLVVTAFGSPASAAVAVAAPGSFAAGFATPVVIAPAATGVTFVNGDIQPHNVIANEDFLSKKDAKKFPWCKYYPKGECPIFWSDTVGQGGTAEVLGLENLTSGSQYSFFCSTHPAMTGTLIKV